MPEDRSHDRRTIDLRRRNNAIFRLVNPTRQVQAGYTPQGTITGIFTPTLRIEDLNRALGGPPAKPELRVSYGLGFFTINWQETNADAFRFEMFIDGEWMVVNPESYSNTSVTFSGVTQKTIYIVRVIATNIQANAGGTTISDSITLKTPRFDFINPPTLSNTPVVEGTRSVITFAPDEDIVSYDISATPHVDISNITITDTSANFTNLAPGTTYQISIVGINIINIRSIPLIVTITTPLVAPIITTSKTDTTITLDWTNITGTSTYRYSITPGSVTTGTGNQKIFSSLLPNFAYTGIVVATKTGFADISSIPFQATTDLTKPVLSVDNATVNSITVKWTDNTGADPYVNNTTYFPGTSTVYTPYTLTISTGGLIINSSRSGDSLSSPSITGRSGAIIQQTFNDLSSGIIYNITLNAHSRNPGISVTSDSLQKATILGQFDISLNLITANSFRVGWSAFAGPTTVAFRQLNTTSVMPTPVIVNVPGSSGIAQFSGAIANTQYDISASAIVSTNAPVFSNILSVFTAPAAFTIAKSTAPVTSTRFTVTWPNVTRPGNSTGIAYAYSPEATITDTSATINYATFTNLIANTIYFPVVTVTNFSGVSVSSTNTLSIITAPFTPFNILASSITSNGCIVTFPNISSPLVTYPSCTVIPAGGTVNIVGNVALITGLNANTIYTISATATNDSGIQVPSSTITITTTLQTLIINRGTVTNNSITVTWAQAPGSIPLVYIGNQPNYTYTNTSMTFTGLSPGSSYTIIVTARNDTLSEVVSNTLTIFTELTPPEITTNILSSNRIQITWSNYTGLYDTTKQLLNGSNVTNLSGNYTTAAGSVLTSDFLNLTDNTYYNIIIAISNVANGLTDVSSNTIRELTPPVAPVLISSNIGTSSFTIRSTNSGNTTNPITYRYDLVPPTSNAVPISGDTSLVSFTGLDPSTSYTVIAYAQNASFIDISSSIVVETLAGGFNLRRTNILQTGYSVSWPYIAGKTYVITPTPPAGQPVLTPPRSSVTYSGLLPNTSQTVTIVESGGDVSAQLVMLTSPANFSLTSSNILAGEFRVNFPVVAGNIYPTHKISISPQGRPRYDASGVRFTGLTANSLYTVTVFASNYSLDTSASIQVYTASAPLILTPTVTSNSIRLSWPPIPNTTYTYALNNVPISAVPDSSGVTFNNLTSNTSYSLRVIATNQSGVPISSTISTFPTGESAGELLVTAPAPFSISGSNIAAQSFDIAVPVISGITYPISGISISPAAGLGGISVSSNLVTFSQLNPDTFYNVIVNAHNNSGVDVSANTIVRTIPGIFILRKILTSSGFDISFNPIPGASYVITKNNPNTTLILDNSNLGLIRFSAQPNATTTVTITATSTSSVTSSITVIMPPTTYGIIPYFLNSAQIIIQAPVILANPNTYTSAVIYNYTSIPSAIWSANNTSSRGTATVSSNTLYSITANADNGSGIIVSSTLGIVSPLPEFNTTISYVDTSSSIVSWSPFIGTFDINFSFVGLVPALNDLTSATFTGLVANTTYPLRILATNNANVYYPTLTRPVTTSLSIITAPGNFNISAGVVTTTTFIVFYPVNTTNTSLAYSFYDLSTLLSSINIDTSSNIITNLFPNTSYIISGRTDNSSGKNRYSTNTLLSITKIAPFSLSINTNLYNSYTIAWQNIGTAAINFLFTINGTVVIPNSTNYGVTNTATFSTGVSQNILYGITVTANNNSTAGIVISSPLSITTRPAPIVLTLSNITNITTSGFTMGLPSYTGNGFIYSYAITGPSSSFTIINTTFAQFTGVAGSSYEVTATASNNSGLPVSSNPLTVITAYAPIVLSRGTITQTSFVVTWTALNYVLSYAFTSNGIPTIPTSSTATSATFSGIPNNSYNIVMTVTNNSFIATTSSALLMTTAPASFDIPMNPYNVSTTDFYLPLRVTTGVTYTYTSVPTSTITYDASSARFAGLSANTTYILTGRANNASGVETLSNQTLPVITKVAPFTLSINTNLHNSYTISWQNSGTTAIIYTFTVNGSALVPDSTAFGATNTATFSTGVTQNTLYGVTVTANNGSIAGTVTSSLLSITTRPAPITISLSNITNIITTGFVMTLPTVTGNGFIYSYDITGGGSVTVINTNSVQFLGAAGSSYAVKATASNNSGLPVISNTLTVITAYAPITLSRGTITQTEFTVTWTALNYVLSYAFTSNGVLTTPTSLTTTSATFSGTPNTSYNIVMTATNNSNIATSSSALLMTTAPASFNIPTNPYNISPTDFYLPLPFTTDVSYTFISVPAIPTIIYDASSARFTGLTQNTTYTITGLANNASSVQTTSTNSLPVITAYAPFSLSVFSQSNVPLESLILTTISWQQLSNISTYTFIGNESIITPSNTINSNFANFKTLTRNTAYSLVLRVTNTSGAITTSLPLSFRTPPAYFNIPITPYNISPTDFYLLLPVTTDVTYTYISSPASTVTYDGSAARFAELTANTTYTITGYATNASNAEITEFRSVKITSTNNLSVITAHAPFNLTNDAPLRTSYTVRWTALTNVATYIFTNFSNIITPTNLTQTSATFTADANTSYNIVLRVTNTSGAVTNSNVLILRTSPDLFNIEPAYNIGSAEFYMPLPFTTDVSYSYITNLASTIIYDGSFARFTNLSSNTTYTVTGRATNNGVIFTEANQTRSVTTASDQVTGLTFRLGSLPGAVNNYSLGLNPESGAQAAVTLFLPNPPPQNPRFIGTSPLYEYVIFNGGNVDRITDLSVFNAKQPDAGDPTKRDLFSYYPISYNTTFTFTVAARNTAGFTGTQSDPITFTTTVPSAPTSVSATAGVGQIPVSWAAPTTLGTGSITSYTVLYKTSSSSTYTSVNNGLSLSRVITGLSSNTTYNVHVYASNSFSNGPVSAQVSAITAPAAFNLSAAYNITKSEFYVPFNFTAGVTYTYSSSPAAGTIITDGSFVRFTGLTSSTTYTVSGRATNASGIQINSTNTLSVTTLTDIFPLTLVITGLEQIDKAYFEISWPLLNNSSPFVFKTNGNTITPNFYKPGELPGPNASVTSAVFATTANTAFNIILSITNPNGSVTNSLPLAFTTPYPPFNIPYPEYYPTDKTTNSFNVKIPVASGVTFTWEEHTGKSVTITHNYTTNIASFTNLSPNIQYFIRAVANNGSPVLTRSVTRTVTLGPTAPMKLRFNITASGANAVTLPIAGNMANIDIDWGDGNLVKALTYSVSHTTVLVYGPVTGFGSVSNSINYRNTFLGIEDFGANTLLTSLEYAYYLCGNVTIAPSSIPSSVTSLSDMFREATSFNQNISSWNTINVTNMNNMFNGATALYSSGNYKYNLKGSWNISNVALKLNFFFINGQDTTTSDLYSPFYVLTLPLSMTLVFNRNLVQVQLPIYNIPAGTSIQVDWGNGTRVTYAAGTGVIQNTLSGGPSSSTVNIYGAFTGFGIDYLANDNYRTYLTTVSTFYSGITNFKQAFYGCTALTSVPSTLPSNVTVLHTMFQDATAIDQNLSGWDTSKVTDFIGMFDKATSMYLPNGRYKHNISRWNVSKIMTVNPADGLITYAFPGTGQFFSLTGTPSGDTSKTDSNSPFGLPMIIRLSSSFHATGTLTIPIVQSTIIDDSVGKIYVDYGDGTLIEFSRTGGQITNPGNVFKSVIRIYGKFTHFGIPGSVDDTFRSKLNFSQFNYPITYGANYQNIVSFGGYPVSYNGYY